MKITVQGISKLLQENDKLMITSHIHPDGDAVGSSLAMYHWLRSMGKDVSIVIDDHVPECFSVLPGMEVIQSSVEEGEADLLLLLDARMGRAGRVTDSVRAPILNIDHHVSNDGSADYLFLDAESSSTCEIIYRMFRGWKVPITREIAMCLYAGIATDTGFFRFGNTTASALETAAELVRLGAEPRLIADAVATKEFEDVRRMAEALQTVELFHGGSVVGILLDRELKDLELMDDLIDMIRFIKEVDIAFLLKYEEENVYRVRMRSRHADVSRILEPFGGGGHVHAAGCTLYMGMEEARAAMMEETMLPK